MGDLFGRNQICLERMRIRRYLPAQLKIWGPFKPLQGLAYRHELHEISHAEITSYRCGPSHILTIQQGWSCYVCDWRKLSWHKYRNCCPCISFCSKSCAAFEDCHVQYLHHLAPCILDCLTPGEALMPSKSNCLTGCTRCEQPLEEVLWQICRVNLAFGDNAVVPLSRLSKVDS